MTEVLNKMRTMEFYLSREEHCSLVMLNSVRDVDVLKSIHEKVYFILIVHLFIFLKESCNKIVQLKRGFSFVFAYPLLFFLFLNTSLVKSCVFNKLLFEFPDDTK